MNDFREIPTNPNIETQRGDEPVAPAQRITGTFRTIKIARVDRWVWLGLGIIVLFITLVSAVAWGAPEPVVAAQAEPDPLVDMIRTSGPAGGLVLLLGYFIRTWQANNTTQLKDLRDTVKELQTKVEGAHNSDGAMREQFAVYRGEIGSALATLRADQAAQSERLARLERRASGVHPRGDG